jgi:hypothetical protein
MRWQSEHTWHGFNHVDGDAVDDDLKALGHYHSRFGGYARWSGLGAVEDLAAAVQSGD